MTDIVGTFLKSSTGEPIGQVVAVAEDGAVTIRPRFGTDYVVSAETFARRYGRRD